MFLLRIRRSVEESVTQDCFVYPETQCTTSSTMNQETQTEYTTQSQGTQTDTDTDIAQILYSFILQQNQGVFNALKGMINKHEGS